MSRTYRRVPPEWNSWDSEDTTFTNKARRGHITIPIRHPDEPFEEVAGPKSKRWAKRRKSRKRRLKAPGDISEQMADLGL